MNSLQIRRFDRVALLSLSIIQYLIFAWSQILLVNYHSFRIPFLDYDSLTTVKSIEPRYLKNICLYSLFWVQHIGMATVEYKLACYKRYSYFVLYDRYLYNISSGLILWAIFSSVEPSYDYIFTIPLWICFPICILGLGILIKGMSELGGRIMKPFTINSLLNQQRLSFQPYDACSSEELKVNGIYAYTRNPMQAGALLLVVFGNGHYTL